MWYFDSPKEDANSSDNTDMLNIVVRFEADLSISGWVKPYLPKIKTPSEDKTIFVKYWITARRAFLLGETSHHFTRALHAGVSLPSMHFKLSAPLADLILKLLGSFDRSHRLSRALTENEPALNLL